MSTLAPRSDVPRDCPIFRAFPRLNCCWNVRPLYSLRPLKARRMAKKDIIVIGGSAGSHVPLRQIIEGFPADLPASIFIATHVPTHSTGYLAGILSTTSRLRVTPAVDGQPIERGCVYVAIPDHHLL